MKEVRVIGLGGYAPQKVVTNDYLSSIVETNDEWIRSRTGIKERRISEGENTSDIAFKAAREALDRADVSPEEIDLIIVATTSPDYFTPSTACLVQAKLGAANALSFDIAAACSGFIYGLNIASQFIKTGQCKYALIIGAEVLSKILDWTDRNTCVLFGDGAGAAVLAESQIPGIISIYSGSDGSKGQFLECPAVPVNNLFAADDKTKSVVTMNGKEIFRFAVKIIPEGVQKVLEGSGIKLEDIKYIVPHQANIRIIEAAAKKLGINEDKFYLNLDKYGNTSAASIPLALNEMWEKNLINKGDRVILVGFGGGLTWGAALIEL